MLVTEDVALSDPATSCGVDVTDRNILHMHDVEARGADVGGHLARGQRRGLVGLWGWA